MVPGALEALCGVEEILRGEASFRIRRCDRGSRAQECDRGYADVGAFLFAYLWCT
jgi:hypothetical protein